MTRMPRIRRCLAVASAASSVLAGCTMIQPDRSADRADPGLATPQKELEQPTSVAATEAWLEPFAIDVSVKLDEMPPLCHEGNTHGDILERIRAGFALPQAEHRAIERQIRQYAAHPAYMRRVFTRALPYLHHIVEQIEARGMPMEFALLPVVESAYDPFAYSHGRAAGLWQFIPGTGLIYELKQNWWYDGRRDVVASTRAALDYLEDLHEHFEGDWFLAIAAYNSGQGNVAKAISRNTRNGQPTEFWHLRLPRETRAYVPKLLAMRELIGNPQRHGLELPSLPDRPYFAEVATHSQIDLAVAADLAGLDVEALYALNPGFNRWATDPAGPHQLLVPVANQPRLEAGLRALPKYERLQWNRYSVRSGDTLSVIADRFGTTVAALKKVNRLSGSTIRVGQHLMIPKASKTPESYTLSAASRLKRTQDQERSGSKSSYTVIPGDTLWDIAMAHGISTRRLAQWNGMAPTDTLSIGTKLVLWSESPSTSANRIRRINYVVRRGDSLSRISSRFNVSLNQIKRWNAHIAKQKYLQPGQRLVMYVDSTNQSG